MARAVRRFGVLALGVAAIVAGLLLSQFRPGVAAFGWTAYAPLSSTAFVAPVAPSVLAGALLILLGSIMVAGWVGFAIGRRQP